MRALAWDTETKGLDWWNPDHGVFLITWADEHGEYAADIDDTAAVDRFRAAVSEADLQIGHNLKFDLHQIRRTLGFDPAAGKQIADTDTMSRLLHPEGASGSGYGHGLKTLAKLYLDPTAADPEDDIKRMAKEIGLSTIKQTGAYYQVYRAYPSVMTRYALMDARYTYDLWEKWHHNFTGKLGDLLDLEMDVLRLLYEAEERGIKTDQAYTAKLKIRYRSELKTVKERCAHELGDEALGGPGSEEALTESLLSIGVPLTKTTTTGKLATNKYALQPFVKDFAVIEDLFEVRRLERFLSTYIGAIEGNDVVHTSFQPIGAWTGRMCIAEGTLIDAPRDLLANPAGIPIEDVEVGSYVYSHDADMVPRPRRVLAKFDQGFKRVLKLVYRAAGSKGYLGELKATPCHRVRLRDGSYRRMDALRPGDQLAFLSRSVTGDGYARLRWQAGGGDGIASAADEHRHLCSGGDVTHHNNENKLDNSLSNLRACTKAEHLALHRSAYVKVKVCPYTAEQFVELVSGGIVNAIRLGHHDHKTLRRWSDELEIPIPDVRAPEPLPVNHTVVTVIDEGEVLPAWDLEIEETPCFVANEIAVHNSCRSPNLQNIPKRAGKEVRGVLVPRPGCSFVVCDLEAVEMRLLAYYLGNEGFKRLVVERDPHAFMASQIWGGTVDDFRKGGSNDGRRSLAKNILFALTYGAGGPRVQSMLLDAGEEVSVARAKEIISTIKHSLPGYYRLMKRIRDKIESVGYVNTIAGRKNPVSKDKSYVGLNAVIQGSAADLLKEWLRASCEIVPDESQFVLAVHDELVFETPHDLAEHTLGEIVGALETVNQKYGLELACSGGVVEGSYANA